MKGESKMGRPSNKEERREQIAEALMRVMATAGYDGASVATVAREAGLTPGLVHYHFQSKLQILLHMLHQIGEAHRSRLASALDVVGEDPRARFEAYIDAHLAVGATADPNAMATWVMLGGEALRNEEVCAAYGRALQQNASTLRQIIDAGVARGAFTCPDPAGATAAFVALIQGYFEVAATARSLIPRGSAASAARLAAVGLLGIRPEESTGVEGP